MSNSRSTSDILNNLATENNVLDNHAALFINDDKTFSPSTVTHGLEEIHDDNGIPFITGTAISAFNAEHANESLCPVISGKFAPDPKTGYAKFLHLGTTRVWNPDGTINEERWKKLVAYVTEGQAQDAEQYATLSRLKSYLAICAKEDPQEPDTGRKANSFFSSKDLQCLAAVKAWEKTYERLACGWKPKADNPKELEPYLTLPVLREFFENSKQVFQKSKTGELPIVKPAI